MVKRLTDAQLAAQLSTARERGKREARQRAVGAWFDATTRHVFVELSNGYLFGFPPATVAGLEHATTEQIEAVEVDSLGEGLRWDALDIDASVSGLVLDAVGSIAAKAIAAAGGRVSTDAKAAAARANGAKGGRPRKDVAHSSGPGRSKNSAQITGPSHRRSK
jgi:hypothetical protein